MPKLGWITNCRETDAQRAIQELLLGNDNRVITIGAPKVTEKYNKKELADMDIVGLYDADKEMADQCRGLTRTFVASKTGGNVR